MGPPGAGKGTQARLLRETLNFTHISTGDMLRVAIKEGKKEGECAKAFIDAGLLVPDELVDEIVKKRLRKSDCDHGFILDGYPRTLLQADTLQKILEHDEIMSVAIGINIADESLIARLGVRWICPNCNRTFSKQLSSGELNGLCDKCGVELIHRADDAVDVIIERLKVYHEQTEPLVRYYQKRGIYKSIDGDQLPASVFYAIRDVVEEKLKSAPAGKEK